MRVILKQKRILLAALFFTVLFLSSLFFAHYFSALNISKKNQITSVSTPPSNKQTQVIEPETDNTNNIDNSEYAPLPFSNAQDEEYTSSDIVQQAPIKKEGILSSSVLQVPTEEYQEEKPLPLLSQEQKEKSPLTTTEENAQQAEPPTPPQSPIPETTEKNPPENLTAIRAVDGDTLVLSNKKTVRLIGINTPEKNQPYYTEAKSALGELTTGKEIRLEKDMSDTDKYGRLLRYVYVDDIFINLEMVKSGLANSYAYPPDTAHQQEFLFAERAAREKGVGLWKKSDVPQSIVLVELYADAEGSDAKNLNGEYLILKNTGGSPISLARWSVKDAGTHIYTFPDFTLTNDATLTLYSGKGTNTQNSLYWNSKDPIWNNDSDTLYLRTASGDLALEYAYSAPAP